MSHDSRSQREALVLSLLEEVSPLLRRYAARYQHFVSFDDLYQEACLSLLRLIDSGIPADQVRHRAFRRVRRHIIDTIHTARRGVHQSVEMLAAEEEEGTSVGGAFSCSYDAEPLMILLAREQMADLLQHVADMPAARAVVIQELGATALAALSEEGEQVAA